MRHVQSTVTCLRQNVNAVMVVTLLTRWKLAVLGWVKGGDLWLERRWGQEQCRVYMHLTSKRCAILASPFFVFQLSTLCRCNVTINVIFNPRVTVSTQCVWRRVESRCVTVASCTITKWQPDPHASSQGEHPSPCFGPVFNPSKIYDLGQRQCLAGP